MSRHAAYGRAIESLDVVVVEDSRHMQTILRSMLTGMGVARLRIYDRANTALKDMLLEPPHVVLSDWRMEPMSGFRLLRAIRHRRMVPLCFVPFVMITGHATRTLAERAFRAGAHQLVVKPLAPDVLARRFSLLMHDDRAFRLDGEHYVVDGVEDMLELARLKSEMQTMLADGLRGRRAGAGQSLPEMPLDAETALQAG